MTEIVFIIPAIERDYDELMSFIKARAVLHGVRYIIKLNYFKQDFPEHLDVEYINMPDDGIYQAWRQALSSISCDTQCYIGFLGVSDRINEVFVQQVLSQKLSHIDLVYGHRNGQKLKNPQNIQLLNRKRIWFDIQHPGLLLRRSLLEDFLHGYFVTVAAQDLELFIRLNEIYDIKPLYINTVQAYMAKDGESYSKNFLRAYLKDWIKIYFVYGVIVKIPAITFFKILMKSL